MIDLHMRKIILIGWIVKYWNKLSRNTLQDVSNIVACRNRADEYLFRQSRSMVDPVSGQRGRDADGGFPNAHSHSFILLIAGAGSHTL